MGVVWGVILVAGVGFLLQLIWGPGRRRREYLLLAFTDRVDLAVTPPVIERIDRRIRDRSRGQSAGGLAAVLMVGVVVLMAPEFVPVGVAGYATTGILVAAMAVGGGVSALRQFPAPRGPDASRIARLDAPSLGGYLHPAWVWAAGVGAGVAAALTMGLLAGVMPDDSERAGLPLAGVAVLAALSISGAVCAAVLSRRLLAIPQPASDELELEWDDALRAYALRDIWIASIGLSAATVVSAFSRMFDETSPGLYVGILIGAAPLVLLAFRASGRASRRLWRHVEAEG